MVTPSPSDEHQFGSLGVVTGLVGGLPFKGQGTPSRLTFLDLDICSKVMLFFIPEKKMSDILEMLVKT